jgi:hypothetical protein
MADIRRIGLSAFYVALLLWLEAENISRSGYKSLLEVLALFQNLDQIKALPQKLDTAKRHLHKLLPLLRIHNRQIAVSPEAQPTKPSKDAAAPFVTQQYWYDIQELCYTILGSNLAAKMHFGMAEYVDKPFELWHYRAWGSSIRAASGEYAYAFNGATLFPGDCVRFNALHLSSHQIPVTYGRIVFVGHDNRQLSPTKDLTVLTLQPIIGPDTFSAHFTKHRCSDLSMILLEDQLLELPASSIQAHVNIQICYEHTSTCPNSSCIVHSVFNTENQQMRSTKWLHPLRAELEIRHYSRKYLMTLSSANRKCRAMPILFFIDGFGIHRNMYRSLKGMYVTPAGLPYAERRKIGNNFTLTLGPHGASFNDVISSFQRDFQSLEKANELKVNGEATTVMMFVLAYTGDMPQQAANGGFLSHRGIIGCRTCYCPQENRGNLSYDIVSNGRYYYETLGKRKEGNGRPTAKERETFWKERGLLSEPSPLQTLTPALDLILSLPYDIPHSEWKGVGGLLHDLLFDGILAPRGQSAYTLAFQHFVNPVGWPHIQSPSTHRGSWSLSEVSRAMILTPLTLRCNAKALWFKSAFLREVQRTLSFLQPTDNGHLLPHDLVIHAYAILASLVSEIGICSSQSTTTSTRSTVLRGREVLQGLIQAVANSHQNQGKKDNWKKKLSVPNIHVALHFAEFATEYGPLMNCNVLAGETRHKYVLNTFILKLALTSMLIKSRLFKQLADKASPPNLMAYLFKKDMFRQSLRLGFAGAWRQSHPTISHQLASIQATCPGLTDSFILSGEPGLLDDSSGLDEFRTFKCADSLFDGVLSSLGIAIPSGFSRGPLEKQFLSRLESAYKDLYEIESSEIFMNCKIQSFANIRFRKRY